MGRWDVMRFRSFAGDERGSASRWFAYAAVAIAVIATVGAHGLAWVANSGRVPVIAFVPLNDRSTQARQISGVDMTSTGSIKPDAQTAPLR